MQIKQMEACVPIPKNDRWALVLSASRAILSKEVREAADRDRGQGEREGVRTRCPAAEEVAQQRETCEGKSRRRDEKTRQRQKSDKFTARRSERTPAKTPRHNPEHVPLFSRKRISAIAFPRIL